MIYLVAIFMSPLALALIGKPFQSLVNLVIYCLAILLLVTLIFAWAGALFWLIGVVHAILAINAHNADKRNRALIEAVKAQVQK
ncbi:MAG TPA: hypothetical protein VEJ16_03190 [Alphaproteobacteria bacterium]|nr:hypothetical protein [Alphaproteobacteria bacterium]